MREDDFHMQLHQETNKRLDAVESTCVDLKTQVSKVHGAVWLAGALFAVASLGIQFIK